VRRNFHFERKRASLRRTIAAERQLLPHPLFSIGAARVMVQARADLRRLERTSAGH
jgi:hypothetical protein